MTTITLSIDPTSYNLEEIFNDIVFRASSGAVQAEGKTGDRWSLSLLYTGLTVAKRRSLNGDLASVKGTRNRAKFILPAYIPGGVTGGTPLLNGAHSAGATSISLKGLPTTTSNVLTHGDYITIGNELKAVHGALDGDGSGLGSIGIWPELHKNYSDGQAVEFDAPFGIFWQPSPAGRSMPADPFSATFQWSLEEDVLA